jgi:hypothetical protein
VVEAENETMTYRQFEMEAAMWEKEVVAVSGNDDFANNRLDVDAEAIQADRGPVEFHFYLNFKIDIFNIFLNTFFF